MKMHAATSPILFAALLHRVAAQNVFNIFEVAGLFYACPSNGVNDTKTCNCWANGAATIDATESNIQQDGAVWTINGLCGQPALDGYPVNNGIEANIYVHDANPVKQVEPVHRQYRAPGVARLGSPAPELVLPVGMYVRGFASTCHKFLKASSTGLIGENPVIVVVTPYSAIFSRMTVVLRFCG
jgi:hypothetical protein